MYHLNWNYICNNSLLKWKPIFMLILKWAVLTLGVHYELLNLGFWPWVLEFIVEFLLFSYKHFSAVALGYVLENRPYHDIYFVLVHYFCSLCIFVSIKSTPPQHSHFTWMVVEAHAVIHPCNHFMWMVVGTHAAIHTATLLEWW